MRPRPCNESPSKDASSTRAKNGFDTNAKAPATMPVQTSASGVADGRRRWFVCAKIVATAPMPMPPTAAARALSCVNSGERCMARLPLFPCVGSLSWRLACCGALFPCLGSLLSLCPHGEPRLCPLRKGPAIRRRTRPLRDDAPRARASREFQNPSISQRQAVCPSPAAQARRHARTGPQRLRRQLARAHPRHRIDRRATAIQDGPGHSTSTARHEAVVR